MKRVIIIGIVLNGISLNAAQENQKPQLLANSVRSSGTVAVDAKRSPFDILEDHARPLLVTMLSRDFAAPKAKRTLIFDTLPSGERLLVITALQHIAQRRKALSEVEEGKLEESDMQFRMPVNEHELTDMLEQTTKYPEYQQYLDQEKIGSRGSWWTNYIPAALAHYLVSSDVITEKTQQ